MRDAVYCTFDKNKLTFRWSTRSSTERRKESNSHHRRSYNTRFPGPAATRCAENFVFLRDVSKQGLHAALASAPVVRRIRQKSANKRATSAARNIFTGPADTRFLRAHTARRGEPRHTRACSDARELLEGRKSILENDDSLAPYIAARWYRTNLCTL